MVCTLGEVALLVTDGPPHKRDNPSHRRVFLGASEAVEKAPSAQRHLHVALVGTLEAVSRGRLPPRWPQWGPEGPQDDPKMAQEEDMMAQDRVR